MLVLFENIDGEEAGACGDLRRSVIQEAGFVQLELADLETHVIYRLVKVIIEEM